MATVADSGDSMATMLRSGRPRKPVEVGLALADLEQRMFGRTRIARHIGRYVVIERLASGGAGTVWVAYDPELDRRVAIKVITAADDRATDELLGEARALAKLAHPNVIAVFDTGVFDLGTLAPTPAAPRQPAVYVVMELVVGVTVTQWLRARRRSLREILGLFGALGRGLAAAHAAGLVHRDVKPANVIVGDDGRARVLDFGLAQHAGSEVQRSAGTPLYMAPEQHAGDTVDARADQYGFCVALAEATGHGPPFVGDTSFELAGAKRARPPELGPRLPRWLRAALLRGLSARPEDRFATMDELLAILERGLGRRRRAAFASGSAAILGVAAWLATTGPEACPDPRARLGSVWDDTRRDAVAAAFATDDKTWSDDSLRATTRALDDFAERWATAHHATCEDTRVHHRVSEAEMNARLLCLERALARLDAVTWTLATAGPELRERAGESVRLLPDVDGCAAARMAIAAELDGPTRARVLELEREVAAAEALVTAGRGVDGLARLDAIEADVNATGHPPLLVALRLMRGSALRDAGRIDDAIAALDNALVAAESAGDQELAIRALSALVLVVAHDARHIDDAERHARIALAKHRAHAVSPAVAIELDRGVATLRNVQGRYEDARLAFEDALALAQSTYGPDHPRTGELLGGLGAVLGTLGRLADARAAHERALEILTAEVGEHHPRRAAALLNLGVVRMHDGDYAAGRSLTEQALAVLRAAHGPEHPTIAVAMNNHGALLAKLGHIEEAAAEFEGSLAIRLRHFGVDSPIVANSLTNLGAMQTELGRHGQALANHERAVAIRVAKIGEHHPDTAMARTNLGTTLIGLGRFDDAQRVLARAVADFTAALGPDSRVLAEPLRGLGEAALALGHDQAAVTALERAIVLASDDPEQQLCAAEARAVLARAIHRSDHHRALGLAVEADALLAALPGTATRREALARWRHDALAQAQP